MHLNEGRRYDWSLKAHSKSTNYSIITAITDEVVVGCQIIKESVKQNFFVLRLN